jgi:molecular chaperone GrpE
MENQIINSNQEDPNLKEGEVIDESQSGQAVVVENVDAPLVSDDQTESVVLRHIEDIKSQLGILQQNFDAKIHYDNSKERIIDNLHKELQVYRDGLHAKILRPIFLDLIAMHDDLGSLLRYNSGINQESEEAVFRLWQNLVSFQQSIEGVLEKHGVMVYEEPGDQYVPQRQRALRTEKTSDFSKDTTIFERIRKGFEYDGKVLRPEIVIIYKFFEITQQPSQEA